MIAAIHQPNYVPWIGYFYKIANCDVFVFLDNAQLPQGRSFANRNKIKTHQGAMWLSVPCRKRGLSGQLISDVQIDNGSDWQHTHWQTIKHNYGRAAYFNKYSDFFEALYQRRWVKLAELNEYIVQSIVKMLDLESKFIRASALEVHGKSTELLTNICRAVGADTYLSGLGGRKYIDEPTFEREGISLRYSGFKHPTYHQLWGEFISDLSIIDLLFNEGGKSLGILSGSSVSP